MRPTLTEIKALVPLLERDWSTPEELASALIQELDNARSGRKLHAAVVQYGDTNGSVFYDAVGPIAGQVTARRVLDKMRDSSIVTRGAVVPLKTLEGFEAHIAEVDKPATTERKK